MKRIVSLFIVFVLCFAALAAAGAETAMVLTPIDAMDMRLGQCMVPQGYTMYPVPDFSGSSRSLTDPLGLGVIVTSPDGRVVMAYEKSSTYLEIVSSTIGGRTYRVHEDGKFDVETMTPMARYQQPAAYAQSYLNGAFPGVEMTYTGSIDLSRYQPLLQQSAQNFYDTLKASQGVTVGMNIDGVALTADICGFSCEMNGEAYFIVVGTVIRALQMTMSMQQLQGMLSETEVIWSPLCTYMLAAPYAEFENVFPAFAAFMENTTISDQFYRANQKLADELRNIVVQSRGGYIDTILKNYTSEDDTYDEERFTDYIFDQNDYTLSDGTHVKIPTSYDYVYEGDNNVVYFSDSAFPEPGTQLSPNR